MAKVNKKIDRKKDTKKVSETKAFSKQKSSKKPAKKEDKFSTPRKKAKTSKKQVVKITKPKKDKNAKKPSNKSVEIKKVKKTTSNKPKKIKKSKFEKELVSIDVLDDLKKNQEIDEELVNKVLKSDTDKNYKTKKPLEENLHIAINKDKLLLISIIINIVLVICLIFVSVLSLSNSGSKANDTLTLYDNVEVPRYADPSLKKIWEKYHEKSFAKEDYVGQIIFESGIINEPFFQAKDNKTYLNKDYETFKYTICGPVFADAYCDLESGNNLILYGHNRSTFADPEQKTLFTPLHILEDSNNYKDNRMIYLVYEDRVDAYLVASLYKIKVEQEEDGTQYLVEGEPKYYTNNFTKEEMKEYIDLVRQRELYDTGVEIDTNDKLLTLQTCYEKQLDKLIIIAKKIDTLSYK